MKISFLKTNLFFKDKNILINLLISFGLFAFYLIFLYLKIQPQVDPIALRYDIYVGVNLIGPWYYVFYIPLIGLLIILINFSLAYIFYLKTKIIAHFLVLAATLSQILLAISAILIYLLNT